MILTLAQYLKEVNGTPSSIARAAKVAPSVVTRYLRGERGISAQTARKISQATQGIVSLEELLFSVDCNHVS